LGVISAGSGGFLDALDACRPSRTPLFGVTLSIVYGKFCRNFNSSMSVQTKSNVPQNEPLRWNLRKAAQEFGTTPDTLKKALNQISAAPDKSGLYSTGQLLQSLYGQLHVEKVRYQRALAERVELENATTTADLLSRSELERTFGELADALKQAVMNSGMPREACENFLHNLATWPLRIQTIVKRQSRSHGAKNGPGDEDQGES
jgi:hypothetical protein